MYYTMSHAIILYVISEVVYFGSPTDGIVHSSLLSTTKESRLSPWLHLDGIIRYAEGVALSSRKPL